MSIPSLAESIWLDATHAVRDIYRRPGFAAVAVVTLALGIGANSAIFSVIQTVLLRPPPFEHFDRLVNVFQSNPPRGFNTAPPTPGDFLDWRERSRSFDHIVGWRNWYYTLSGVGGEAADRPETVKGVRASPSLFPMLGVKASLGRTFRPDEEEPGRSQVVLLSHGLWQRRFGGDPAMVGRRVVVDGRPFVVVGVLPADFQFLQPDFAIWMPLTIDAELRDRVGHSIAVFARLALGVTLTQAQADMSAIARSLEQVYPESNTGWGARVVPLYPSRAVRELRPALLVLFAAAGCVLLIACANVASMVLARGVMRQREVAIRATIGATRVRLVRQMLTESVLLAGLGGVAGLLLARWGLRALILFLPRSSTYQALKPELDPRVLGFTFAVAVATAILVGLFPAVQSTSADSLRVSASSPSRMRVRRFLVGAELALSILLLIGAGLLLKSYWVLQRVDTGFPVDRLLSMQVWLPQTQYPDAASIRGFYQQVLGRVETLPGVRSAGATSFRSFLGWAGMTAIDIEGRAPKGPGDVKYVSYRVVTPNYLRTLGQRLVRGRDLADGDGPDAAGVAVINEAFARRFFPDEDPIGRHVRPGFRKTSVPWEPNSTTRWLQIVGVAGDIKEFRLTDGVEPVLYVSYLQNPSSLMFLLLRTETEPEALIAAVQREVHAVDPTQPVTDIRTIEDALSDAVGQPRFNMQLVAFFAALALLLSAVGVYGVISYLVSQRRHEIGVRMALGARPRDVVRMVVGEGLALAACGIAAGLIGAAAATRWISASLYGVSPTDVGTFAATPLLLLAVTSLACYLPARRAARVNPAFTLRE